MDTQETTTEKRVYDDDGTTLAAMTITTVNSQGQPVFVTTNDRYNEDGRPLRKVETQYSYHDGTGTPSQIITTTTHRSSKAANPLEVVISKETIDYHNDGTQAATSRVDYQRGYQGQLISETMVEQKIIFLVSRTTTL